MIVMASNGHFLTQIPQPMQRNSDMKAILSVGFTSIQSLPERPSLNHARTVATDYTDPFSRRDMIFCTLVRNAWACSDCRRRSLYV
ncbi:hypothetical protein EDB83DRAFT_2355428 [Lactarius deliciosus]|nr:hypothetical protein EDB83DRAFT_2355428 [Lactarius deliciosus]